MAEATSSAGQVAGGEDATVDPVPVGFIDVAGPGDAPQRRIAVRTRLPVMADAEDAGPVSVMWLPGFNSDMISTKATVLDGWAAERGHGCIRFDYFAHGESDGARGSGTMSLWTEDACAALAHALPADPVRRAAHRIILIGSSMGGWVALTALRRMKAEQPELAALVAGLVLIAPAWDMSEKLMWEKFSDDIKAELEREGVWMRPSAYGEPYAITRALIEDGRHHLLSGEKFAPGVPVRIIQGMRDPDVPMAHVLALVDELDAEDIQTVLIKDGEHRLSRPQDLAVLLQQTGNLVADVAGGAA